MSIQHCKFGLLEPNVTDLTKIKPFRAIRPTRDKAYLVATLPHYAYKQNVLEAKLESNPFTYLHVMNPEFSMQEDKNEPYSIERCHKSREKLDEFMASEVLMQDEKEALYLYRQTYEDRVYVGLIGGASVDDYNNGVIKKHEATLTEREKHFTRYLHVVECNAEPVLLFHEENPQLIGIFDGVMSERPEYEFTTTQKVKHEVWIMQDPQLLARIQRLYQDIPYVYIADGHHRCASSSRFSEEVDADSDSLKNHFLAYFISEKNMKILDYNRLISDIGDLPDDVFMEMIAYNFEVQQLDDHTQNVTELHKMMMYFGGHWYLIQPREGQFDENDPVSNLDTDILTTNLLTPILNIEDLKTDDRVSFIHGGKGLEGVKESVDSGENKVGFVLFPVSVEQLKKVADHDRIMPPKSTWIEPKLRSGLTMYPLHHD